MSNVVRFRNAKEREDEDLRAAALEVIEAFGPAAGLEVGRAAHAWRLSPGSRARLLALADEIESVQGYGWWWGEAAAADNASSSPTGHPAVSPAIPAKKSRARGAELDRPALVESRHPGRRLALALADLVRDTDVRLAIDVRV